MRLIVTIAIIMVFYISLAIDLFSIDKAETVSNLNLSNARFLVTHTNEKLKPLIASLKSFSENPSLNSFDKNSRFLYFAIFQPQSKSQFEKTYELRKSQTKKKYDFDEISIHYIKMTKSRELTVASLNESGSLTLVVLKSRSKTQSGVSYFVALINAKTVGRPFAEINNSMNFLIDGSGQIVFGPKEDSNISSFKKWNAIREIQKTEVPDGTIEGHDPSSDEDYLVSFAKTRFEDFTAITISEKWQTLSVLRLFLLKSFIFFFALCSLFSFYYTVFLKQVRLKNDLQENDIFKEAA